MSLPSRERGLKFLKELSIISRLWVAPLAGAWIEIRQIRSYPRPLSSLPSRERGLKSTGKKSKPGKKMVAPLAGAWIEI